MTTTRQTKIGVLLDPVTRNVADVFRFVLSRDGDVALVDVIEDRIARLCDPYSARSMVADAMLIGMALRNHRINPDCARRAPSMAPLMARQASEHECALFALIDGLHRLGPGHTKHARRDLVALAAERLDLHLAATMIDLMIDLGRSFETAGHPLSRIDWQRLLCDRIEVVAMRRASDVKAKTVRY